MRGTVGILEMPVLGFGVFSACVYMAVSSGPVNI